MKKLLLTIYLFVVGHVMLFSQITGQIELRADEFTYSKYEEYDVVKSNTCNGMTDQVGAPELPVIIKTFVVPLDASIKDINADITDSKELKRDVLPLPVSPPVPVVDIGNQAEYVPDSAIYNGTSVYPEKDAEIIADYYELGYHLVKVRINPVKWDPVSGSIYLHSLYYTLNYSVGTGEYTSPKAQSRYRSKMTRKVIETLVDNPQDIERHADKKVKIGGSYSADVPQRTALASNVMIVDILAEQIPDYIIITNKELKDEFKRLADWKIQKGIPTIIKDVDEIKNEYLGADTPEKIHAYLRECYEKWGEGLFVLLGGDVNIIPARFYSSIASGKIVMCPSDSYYSDLTCDWNGNKNHLYAEADDKVKLNTNCYVGRASVENINEAVTFVNKVLAYEKMNSPSVDTEYLLNHLAADAYISKNDTGFLSNGAKDYIDGYLKKYPLLNEHKWYLFDHYNCTCNNHKDKIKFARGQEFNKENFIAALNDGSVSGLNHFHIVYHMDHCSPRSMGTSCKDKNENMSIQDIDNLRNGDYLQIVISGGCETTCFDKDCVAEHFVNNPNGGAVAFIGNANYGFSSEHTQYENFLNNVYGTAECYNLGVLLLEMVEVKSVKNASQQMRLHLIGDPEMSVWSAVPQTFDVDADLDLEPQSTEVVLKVNNLPEGESAFVCLYKDKEIYKTIEIYDTLQHRFAVSEKSAGLLKITVTGKNFIPYEKNIQLSGIDICKGQLKVERISGFNGSINIGDSVTIGIFLRNTGFSVVRNVKATLYTDSPYIKVINGDNIDYGNIGLNGIVSRNFKICVSDDAQEVGRNELYAPCLYLRTQSDNGKIAIDTFNIAITSPRLRIGRISVVNTENGNLIPEAGESVDLDIKTVMLGKETIGTVSLSILPEDDNIASVSVNETCGKIKVASHYKTGLPLNLKIVLAFNNIPQDSCIVNIAEQLPVLSQSHIHCSPTYDRISLYWDNIGSVPKYNVYRSSTSDGIYTCLNKMPLEARYYCDENLLAYTTYYYKVVAVSNSNLEGILSEPVKATTTVPVMLYKEQPTDVGNALYHYECEANAVDIDYDGNKEIILTSYESDKGLQSTVVAVRPDGSEPYCIGGNATKFNGFAQFDWLVSAAPTVADLYGNGEMSIVSLSRRTGGAENYAVCYSASDKNGDNQPDKQWQIPSEVNVYRGGVATDIDAPDGKGEKEIIYIGENKRIVVLNADGTKKAVFGENITSNYGGLAVADLDGDGYKEIIYGQGESLYVWKYDGSPFLRSPFFTRSGMNMKSSPVVCDIDNDGEKEIILATRNNPSYIYAIKLDGTCVGNFDNNASVPVSIPYPSGAHQGLDHAVSVGDINADGKLEVVALGGGCVKAWTNTGDLIFTRNISGLFANSAWATHLTVPLLADVDGDSAIDIVFKHDNRILAIRNDGSDIDGFQLTGDFEFSNNILISDIDDDGKSEIVAADKSGFITVWKTEGSAIEWGRARFDTGFTGEYVSGYKDMMVIKSDMEWMDNNVYPNDIIVRSSTLRISSGRTLNLCPSYKIIVFDGGILEIDGGIITDANIFVKSGGMLKIKNNGTVKLSKYATFDSEEGAIIDIESGEIE